MLTFFDFKGFLAVVLAFFTGDCFFESASDWFDICNLSSLPEGSYVAIFIDNSSATQASYDALVTKLTAKNITVITVTNSNPIEDWITPFIGDLS